MDAHFEMFLCLTGLEAPQQRIPKHRAKSGIGLRRFGDVIHPQGFRCVSYWRLNSGAVSTSHWANGALP